MFIALYLTICLDITHRATCTNLPVIDNTQDTTITIERCMGIEGAASSMKFWQNNIGLHDKFKYGGWACRVGNKKAPDNGGA